MKFRRFKSVSEGASIRAALGMSATDWEADFFPARCH